MSLVDYASSSEDDNDPEPVKEKDFRVRDVQDTAAPAPAPTIKSPAITEQLRNRPLEKLPDAALLLGQTGVPFSLGKRDPDPGVMPRGKIPKNASHRSKAVSETGLLPPQLSGRSNVVTEDVGKLFVRKHAVSTSSSNPN